MELETEKIIAEIRQALVDLRREITVNKLSEKWIPIKSVMEWLDYGPTQMASLIKSRKLLVVKIGRRKFIARESIEKYLIENQI